MKKLVPAMLVLALVLSAFSCVAFADGERMIVADTFAFTVTEEGENIFNTVFTEPVVISGEYGAVCFTDCVFLCDITNVGGESAIVRCINCRFVQGTKCVIQNDLKDVTIDTPVPKFMFVNTDADVLCDNVGAVVAMKNDVIHINGEDHGIEDCDTFLDSETGEMSPYAGQANESDDFAHNYCIWKENGEPVHFHIAIPTN